MLGDSGDYTGIPNLYYVYALYARWRFGVAINAP
jgi:hypothetical protein